MIIKIAYSDQLSEGCQLVIQNEAWVDTFSGSLVIINTKESLLPQNFNDSPG
jgi:hypothetical protein